MLRTNPESNLRGYSMSLLAIGMFALCFGSNAATVASPHTRVSQPADTILVQKLLNTRKHKIKLTPSVNNQVLFFSVNGEDGRLYQLYLFDVEGKLVKRINIRNKETTVLNNMGKGSYLYEIFSEDERIENGQVFIR
ncbi:T9SS type A sorting domain-containing protein [Paraflavitalea sp. CAU 1676]|uniref:T9SS type A sorting domain-containing protein n=1 Tax=Paraflavitalea sp. CAU 1676 TaxID=3032598 RepID=UPI0023DCB537|nr:T9SS type A sorting domain-containing protein [Paraflavitalea sp. CAU 1676]MDF2192208.1 T9SS type A sorting domain-containing protein [Paraflavitalea sp. CAU 1676]